MEDIKLVFYHNVVRCGMMIIGRVVGWLVVVVVR